MSDRPLLVLTSGGDAPGMNPCLRAVVKIAAARGVRTLGVLDGYDGLVDGALRPLTRDAAGTLVPETEVDAATDRGGTLLGSARSTRFRTPEGRKQALAHLDGAAGLIVIGGDGSLTGAHILAGEAPAARIVGIPASIDNDVGCSQNALGVDTALNTILDACDRIMDTASSHRRAFIVEVMGRRSGYLALTSAVAAGADGVLMPEHGRSEEDVVAAVTQLVSRGFSLQRRKRAVLVIKAEGVEVPCTRLARLVEERVKDVVPPIDVRATVLGHVVRGGAPTYVDRMLGGRLALAAVDAVLSGATDEMVAFMPPPELATPTSDPAVGRVKLADVLRETKAMLEGTSPMTKWRLALLEKVEGVLPL